RGAVRPADASPDLVPLELEADLVTCQPTDGAVTFGSARAPRSTRATNPYRLGNGVGNRKDSRSRCPDELFGVAPVLCSWLPASTAALLTGTIISFSVRDEAVFSAGVAWELSELVGSTCSLAGS